MFLIPIGLNILPIIFCRFLFNLNNTLACCQMNKKVFIRDRLSTFITHLCPRFTYFQMRVELCWWHFLFAVLTEFGFFCAITGMGSYISRAKLHVTVLTCNLFMKLFLMLINGIDIIHLSTFVTALDVPAAVTKVSGYFGLWEHLEAVITLFHLFFSHLT